MDFLKRNLFMIGIGLGAVVGIALGVKGLQGMPKVKAEMENAQRTYQDLNALANAAANRRALFAQKRRIAQALSERSKIVERTKALYGYKPLVDGVFPDGPADKRLEFRDTYGQAVRALYKKDELHWGMPADPIRVELMQDKIVDERARAAQAGETSAKALTTRSGVLTLTGAKLSARSRADVQEAQKIYLYLTPVDVPKQLKLIPSLQLDETMEDTDTVEPPLPEDCWFAQLNYWIQKDVIDAIKSVNNAAADRLKQAGEPRWVGAMPVKDIVSIRVTPFYIPAEGDPGDRPKPGDPGAAEPAGTPVAAFTGDGENEFYEVVQSAVKLVMDQRDVPELIAKLTANRFHTLLRLAYEPVKPNREMVGKIYGSGPVITVVMEFETVFLGDVFRPLMPIEVCEQYEIACPESSEGDTTED